MKVISTAQMTTLSFNTTLEDNNDLGFKTQEKDNEKEKVEKPKEPSVKSFVLRLSILTQENENKKMTTCLCTT